jgi:hypothetical protein
MNVICQQTGKRVYRHYQQAARIVGIARKQGKGLAVVPVSIYRCEHGQHWHCSSMTQLEHEVRQLARESA